MGEAAIRAVAEDWLTIREELGGRAELEEMNTGRFRIHEFLDVDPSDAQARLDAAVWVRERLRTYVGVLRPRIRTAVRNLIA